MPDHRQPRLSVLFQSLQSIVPESSLRYLSAAIAEDSDDHSGLSPRSLKSSVLFDARQSRLLQRDRRPVVPLRAQGGGPCRRHLPSSPNNCRRRARIVNAGLDGAGHVLGAFDAVQSENRLDGNTSYTGHILPSRRVMPVKVPLVPSAARKWVTRPLVCSMISGPVVSKWAIQFAGLLYWSG